MTLQDAKQELLRDLRANTISGLEFGRNHSKIMDDYIRDLTKYFAEEDIAIIATGGYGREELCPHSDIDLLFLTPSEIEEKTHAHIEKFLYKIWDSGIKIGHSVRTPQECICILKQDTKAFSSLLDARLIIGCEHLYKELQELLCKHLNNNTKKRYVQGKLKERDIRHKRLGDTRYVLEPNIKDGKGGLRDYQTLFWISRVIHDAATPKSLETINILTKKERQAFEKDYEFLLTIRCHMHDIAQRAEERLHFDIQPTIAKRLGYKERNNAKSVERFMKHYFLVTKNIGDLTRIIVASIEDSEDQKHRLIKQRATPYKKFAKIGERLTFQKDQKITLKPLLVLEFFRLSQTDNLDIHPQALQKIRRNIKCIDKAFQSHKRANKIFLDILTDANNAALTLRRMNEAGVLERFIPDFGRIKGLMQFDRYHAFTVDEHTLHAIDIMHKLEAGHLKDTAPLASCLMQTVENRKTLYIAMLLHDICKGREKKKAGEDHASLGADLALKLAPRLQLSDPGTRLVSWLIYDHLLMSEIAFKRDLQDPKTIQDFVFRIHDLERLKLLTILTVCDIMAVGPDRYTPWKEHLLTELYTLAKSRLSGQKPKSTVEHKADKKADNQNPIIEITQDNNKNATIIHISAKDRHGLFSTICGALSASNVNIIEAEIHTTREQLAEDVFVVQTPRGNQITKALRQKEIKEALLFALKKDKGLEEQVITKRQKPKTKELVFDVENKIIIKNNVSDKATYIEIQTRDYNGLLYDIARVLQAHNLSITRAKINTLGLKAIDAFYVTDKNSQKILDKFYLRQLKKALFTNICDM